ncbi:AAA family ATPase [Novosphingobium aquiterrae]|uniref:AAA family ATPase n=1 Tax=Novosphingobium aquiterrae TaxID=624388 RepID=A0ABV6PLR3_9SPHN
MITVCFHGAESTGKSVLAARLSAELGIPWVPEYGRTYCEQHGTDLAMADLLAIASGEAAEIARAAACDPPLLLLDTDQLMTAAWAQKLFGQIPDSLLSYPKADLYLHFAADVPWVEDGTRFFGADAERNAFDAMARAVLERSGVHWRNIAGSWGQREAQVRDALAKFIDIP